MKSKTRVRAAIFPNPYDENHWMKKYNPLLYEISEKMKDHGVDTVGVPEVPSLWWLVKNNRKIDLVHWHFPEFYYFAFREAALNFYIGRHSVGLFIDKLIRKLFKVSIFALWGNLWVHIFMMLCRLFKIGMVWTLHDLYPHHLPSENFNEEHRLRVFMMRHMNSVIFTCEMGRNLGNEKFGTPRYSTVASFGSYRGFYPDTITREEARSYLGFKDTDLVFLFFGNQRLRRNAINLVKAFKQMPYQNIRLIVAGKTPPMVQEELEPLAWGDWRIRCYYQLVSAEQMEYLFKSCDFVVMPGEQLTSAVIATAISYERPVIAPNYGCAMEMVQDAGLFFAEGEDDGLKRVLEEAVVVDLPDLFEKARKRSMQTTWDDAALRTSEAYFHAVKSATG
jgi:glycosyltransferase involved in cell wall biosynthesis